MKKRLICIALSFLILMTGCSNSSASNQGSNVITDLAGDEVELPDEIVGVITRVNTASFMAAMGKADLIKGTYKYMQNDKWAGFMFPELNNAVNFTSTPTAESFYELDANLCLWSSQGTSDSLRSHGIASLTITFEEDGAMKRTADIMGEIFDEKKWAEKWNEYYDNTLEMIEKRTKDIENKKVVYYVHGAGNEGIYHTAAGGTISEKWILQSGGVFATHDTTGFGIDITAEELIKMDPQVIVIGGIYHEAMEEELYSDATLSQITAVKEQEIYNVPVGLIPWDQYGVEYPLLCLWTAKILYPEQFEDVDMIDETIKFYDEYCGVTLTKEQAQYMIDGKAPDGGSLHD